MTKLKAYNISSQKEFRRRFNTINLEAFMKKVLIILSVLIFIISCGKKDTKIEVKDGVKHISNSGEEIFKEIKLSEVFSIDLLNNKDSLANCYSPYFKMFDNEGNLYIGNEKTSLIKKFDKDGNFLLSFGGRGKGPGEFISYGNNALNIAIEDTLYIHDDASIKYLLFTKEGKFIRNMENIIFSEIYSPTRLAKDKIIGLSSKTTFSENKKTAFSTTSVVLFNDNMKKIKSFDEIKDIKSMKIETVEYIEWSKLPFDQELKLLPVKNGFFISKFSDSKLFIEKFDLSGKKVMEIEKSYRKKPFKDQKDRDYYGFGKRYKNRKYKRSVTGLFEDGKHRLWVATPNDGEKKGTKFYIFEDGIYKFSTILDLGLKSELFLGGISFVGDKLYLFNFDDNFGVKCYNIIEE